MRSLAIINHLIFLKEGLEWILLPNNQGLNQEIGITANDILTADRGQR